MWGKRPGSGYEPLWGYMSSGWRCYQRAGRSDFCISSTRNPWEMVLMKLCKVGQKSLSMFQQLQALSVLVLKVVIIVRMDYGLVSRVLLWEVKDSWLNGQLSGLAAASFVCRRGVQRVFFLDGSITKHLSAWQLEWWHPDSSYTPFIPGFFSYSWSCKPIMASLWTPRQWWCCTFLGHRFGSHYSGEMSPIVLGILYLRMHRDVRDVMFMTWRCRLSSNAVY